jgi:hypothetical protein
VFLLNGQARGALDVSGDSMGSHVSHDTRRHLASSAMVSARP